MEMLCQVKGYNLFVEVLQEKLRRGLELLKMGLIDKRLYRKELKLRNELLQETIEEQRLTA